jgi:hypothetical protein
MKVESYEKDAFNCFKNQIYPFTIINKKISNGLV